MHGNSSHSGEDGFIQRKGRQWNTLMDAADDTYSPPIPSGWEATEQSDI